MVRYEYDLRPYSTSGAPAGTKGGTFPYAVALKGNIAYVGADRDREIVVVDVSNPAAGSFVARIPLDGNPNGMTLSQDGSTLFVAQDNQDQVAVINTATNTITHKIDTRGPTDLDLPANTTGAAPTAVAINRRHKNALCGQRRFELDRSDTPKRPASFPHHRPYPDRIRPHRCCIQR